MRVLIIGGTGVISTGISNQLLERGGCVLTLFNRGKTAPEITGQFNVVTGDRTDFKAFESWAAGQKMFDAVIDMVAFKPAEVESAVRAFKGRTSQYVFCSTTDVYTKPAAQYPVVEEAEREPAQEFGYAYDRRSVSKYSKRRTRAGNSRPRSYGPRKPTWIGWFTLSGRTHSGLTG